MKFEQVKVIEEYGRFSMSEDFILFRQLRESRLLLYMHRSNYQTLIRSIDKFHEIVNSMGFWDPVHPHLRWQAQKRITRDLFNYLSSASAIIDISRIFSRRHLNATQLSQYLSHTKKEFVEKVENRILRNLRNYISHYSFLQVGVYFQKDMSGESKSNFYLNPTQLLEWDDWNGEEKEFLINKGNKFEIEMLIKEYHLRFMNTQDALYLGAIKNHKVKLVALSKNMSSLLKDAEVANFVNSLPFRRATLRYLNRLIDQSNKI